MPIIILTSSKTCWAQWWGSRSPGRWLRTTWSRNWRKHKIQNTFRSLRGDSTGTRSNHGEKTGRRNAWSCPCINSNEIVPFLRAAYFGARPVGGNLVESSPVVGFQSKPPEFKNGFRFESYSPESVDAQDCTATIADQNIQDPVVPPSTEN